MEIYQGKIKRNQRSTKTVMKRWLNGLEKVWKTDFDDMSVDNRVEASVEDKKALAVMEESLKMVSGHFQVMLPWKQHPPPLPNNKKMAEERLQSLKNCLMKDDEMLEKYKCACREDPIGRVGEERMSNLVFTPPSSHTSNETRKGAGGF